MLPETRDALPYAQLQEGLKYDLMEAPAVWSVGLYVAAKSEERRLAGLQKQKQYQSSQQRGFKKASPLPQGPVGASQPKQWAGRRSNPDVKPKKCWTCDLTGHMA